MATALTPEQIKKAQSEPSYFYSLTAQQQAQVVSGGASYNAQGIANAQAAAGVAPAIPATAGDGAGAGPKPVDSGATKALGNIASSEFSKRYPRDIGESVSDYMIFDFYDYTPPFSKAAYAGTSLSEYNKSNTELQAAKEFNQIILYMPEGVSASYKANWDGKKFGNIAAGILASAGSAAMGDLGGFFRGLGETSSDTAKRAPAQVGASAVSAIINGITGDSVGTNDIFSSVGGQILNPNAELIFGGHDLRTFTFTYKLVPYNELEAKIIFEKKVGIIDTFKRAMLPSFGGDKIENAGSNFSTVNRGTNAPVGFIKNPKLVQVNFMSGSSPHPFLPRFKPCSITDFDVNYTADGVYAAHLQGYPSAVEITVSLTETKLIYSEDIPNGF